MSDPLRPASEPVAGASAMPQAVDGGHAWSTGRRVAAWINMIVMVVLLLAILVGVNYAGAVNFRRYDLTANAEYRIRPASLDLLTRLNAPVKLVFFQTAPLRSGDAYERLMDMLDEFRRHSPQITVKQVRSADPQEIYKEVKDLKLETVPSNESLVVFAGGRNKTLPLSSMYEMDWQSRMPRLTSFSAESQLTGAIRELTEDKPPALYFARGHGASEGRTDGGDNDDPSRITLIARRLKERENIEVKTVNLLKDDAIPPDCKVLVIHHPTTRYGDKETGLLRDFLKRGGRLFVLTATVTPKGFVEAGLDGLLAEWGVKPGRNVVMGLAQTMFGLQLIGRPPVSGEDFGTHAIVDQIRKQELDCRLGLTHTVERAPGTDTRLTVTPLITLSGGWWGETSFEQFSARRPRKDPEDVQGSLVVAQAVSAPVSGVDKPIDGETRLVVVGDEDFVSDGGIQSAPGNEDLFIGAALWLMGREKVISAGESKFIADRSVSFDGGTRKLVTWGGIFGLPIFGACLGFGLWFVRRK